jgi:sulfoxide reductase heme-binding subunit YedZ
MSMQPAIRSSNQLGRPLGTSRDWRRRLLLHHMPLALASAVFLVLFVGLELFDLGGRSMARWTMATGYVALVLLGLTLVVGPTHLLLRKRNPVSSYLRRDVGAWTAIFSIAHVILGFQVHGAASDIFTFTSYFFFSDGTPKTNAFGLGNWIGLGALVIVAGLLAISTDGALRELKARRWKSLQRLNYALFVLVVLHAFFYGALLRVTSPFTLVLIATVTVVVVGQTLGIWLWRRRVT